MIYICELILKIVLFNYSGENVSWTVLIVLCSTVICCLWRPQSIMVELPTSPGGWEERQEFQQVNRNVTDTELLSQNRTPHTSARKIYANRQREIKFVFSPCWSPNMFPWCNFTPCLKKLVQNNSESTLVSHYTSCHLWKGVQYPAVGLSINTSYQVYKIQGDVIKQKTVDKPNKCGWPDGLLNPVHR